MKKCYLYILDNGVRYYIAEDMRIRKDKPKFCLTPDKEKAQVFESLTQLLVFHAMVKQYKQRFKLKDIMKENIAKEI